MFGFLFLGVGGQHKSTASSSREAFQANSREKASQNCTPKRGKRYVIDLNKCTNDVNKTKHTKELRKRGTKDPSPTSSAPLEELQRWAFAWHFCWTQALQSPRDGCSVRTRSIQLYAECCHGSRAAAFVVKWTMKGKKGGEVVGQRSLLATLAACRGRRGSEREIPSTWLQARYVM